MGIPGLPNFPFCCVLVPLRLGTLIIAIAVIIISVIDMFYRSLKGTDNCRIGSETSLLWITDFNRYISLVLFIGAFFLILGVLARMAWITVLYAALILIAGVANLVIGFLTFSMIVLVHQCHCRRALAITAPYLIETIVYIYFGIIVNSYTFQLEAEDDRFRFERPVAYTLEDDPENA